MRRPIVFMLGAFTAGLTAAHTFLWPWQYWMGAVAVLVVSGAVLVLSPAVNRLTGEGTTKRRGAFAVLMLLVLVVGAAYFAYRDSRPVLLPEQSGTFHVLEGYVLSAKPAANETQKHRLVVQGPERVVVSFKGDVPEIRQLVGRKVRIRGTADIPEGPSNPGMFDYRLYLKSLGVRVTMNAQAGAVEQMDAPIRRFTNGIACFKALFWQQISDIMGQEEAAILFGMLFGDSTYIGQEVYEDFQKNGTAHILSVSGIHVGIIYACLEKTLGRKMKRSMFYNTVAIMLLLFYAALSDFAPCVMRAAFMIIVYILSKQMLRPYDFTTCIAFTALVLLIQNPFYIYNTGFILSYGAVFVLAVLLPTAQRGAETLLKTDPYGLGHQKKTWAERLTEVFLPVCIIQIGMVPLTAYFFNYFSLAAFFVNIPVIFLSGFLLPLGFLLMAFSFLLPVCPFLFHFCAFLTEYPIHWMIWINHLTAKEGVGFFNTPSPSLKWVVLYYLVIFFLTCEMGQVLAMSQGRKKYACGALVTLLVFTLLLPEGKLARADLVFIDVGQGDGLHIKTPGGKNILIDGGGSVRSDWDVGKNVLYPYFMKNGVTKIDLAIITHMHEDHYGGLTSLAALMPVKKIAMFEGYKTDAENVNKTLNIMHKYVIYLNKGETIQVDPDVSIQVLYPSWKDDHGKKESDSTIKTTLAADENENSLVLRINYRGTCILNTGDLPAGGEQELLKTYVRQNNEGGRSSSQLLSHILKIGHHGSETSSCEAFLEAVSPGAAIIQVGRKNSFGHPAAEVTERLDHLQIPIYRNDEQGAILLDIDKKGVRILDMKEKTWKWVQ